MSFSLRLIRAEDEALILRARNSESVRHFMLSPDIITSQTHAAWMAKKLQEMDTAPYFLFLHDDTPIGVVGITHYVAETENGEWGFYIFAPDAPKGTGTIMLAAFLDVMFARGIRRMTSLVFAHNAKSLALHEKLGFSAKGVVSGQARADVAVWSLSRQQWQLTRQEFVAQIEQVTVFQE